MEIYILIIIILVPTLLFLSIQDKNSSQFLIFGVTKNIPRYTRKSKVMNGSESAFFFELQKQLPVGYYIFPKMRIADVLDIPDGHDYYKMRNKALPKHIDFLICDKHFKPLVAIEVNGSSHHRWKQQEADQIKQEMFRDSGLSLETVDVGSNFTEAISRIKETLLHA